MLNSILHRLSKVANPFLLIAILIVFGDGVSLAQSTPDEAELERIAARYRVQLENHLGYQLTNQVKVTRDPQILMSEIGPALDRGTTVSYTHLTLPTICSV